jgi:hypothetical protein
MTLSISPPCVMIFKKELTDILIPMSGFLEREMHMILKQIGSYGYQKNAYYVNGALTGQLSNGTYYLVFQHPDPVKTNTYGVPIEIVYNITRNSTKHQIVDKTGHVVLNISDIENNRISGKEAADILFNTLSKSDPDMICERITVNVT